MSSKAIIIGASSGIGRALAEVLSREGYTVGLTARRFDRLENLKKKLPGPAYIKLMDIRCLDEARRIVGELIQEMGGIDLMVVNAAINHSDEEPGFKEHLDVLQTNVLGFMAICQSAAEKFTQQGTGHLVGISSITALRGNGRIPAYSASKAFVSNYLEGLRQSIGSSSIHVTDIIPGFVETAMTEDSPYSFWMCSAETAAEQIYKAIQKKARSVFVTKRWVFIGAIYKAIPGFIYDWVFRKIGLKKVMKSLDCEGKTD